MREAEFDPRDPETKRGIMLRFKETMQILAASADEQIAAFPEGFESAGDELALDFTHWQTVATSHYHNDFSKTQLAHLRAIDHVLDRVEDEVFWPPKGVREAKAWQTIREHAQAFIHALGWKLEAPTKWHAKS